jgi:PTS system nitrogen regulatory IIA component
VDILEKPYGIRIGKLKMKLIDVLRKECIVANATMDDKADALRQVVQAAKQSPVLKDLSEAEILAGLEGRESLGSTGFGKGIAIPHCRLSNVTEFVVGIISVDSGVDFKALDGKKVKLIIFIIAPEAESNKHLKLLSAISQTLLIPGAVKELLSESCPEAICESFIRHTRDNLDTSKQKNKCMFNIFIQNEEVFHEILARVAGIETGSVVIANTENSRAYLTKTPLFADFWRDEPDNFSKVITFVIEKGLCNEVIRRIEGVTGSLSKYSGVMVTVQDISYNAGSL